MTDEKRHITAQISPELARRIDAIRSAHSIDGTPNGGPAIAVIVRMALMEWVDRHAEDAKL